MRNGVQLGIEAALKLRIEAERPGRVDAVHRRRS